MHRIKPDAYRPLYHFSPPYGWMNDPNGLVWHKGTYHLYYQWYPYSTEWNSMHWGHATSRDLLHWQDEGAVFVPLGPDTDHWSGCAVYDKNNTSGFFGPEGGVVVIYTYRDGGVQQQHVAFSHDGGASFVPYEGNPVIPNPGVADFRDPKVFWMEEDAQWHMVLAKYDVLEFYASKNLLLWEKTGEFGKGYGLHAGYWECPDLYPLPVEGSGQVKWLLHAGDSPASRTQYFVGDFDGAAFHCDYAPEAIHLLDYGYENYSGVTFSDTPDGRRLLVGWLNGTWLWNCTPTQGWRGVFSVPRQMRLVQQGDEVRAAQAPLEELRELHGDAAEFEGVLVDGLSPMPLEGECLDITLRIRPEKGLHAAGVVLAATGADGLVIGVDFDKRRLFVDRSLGCKNGFTGPGQVFAGRIEAPLEWDGEVDLRILFDRTVAEVFACEGTVCLSALYFPRREGNRCMFFAQGNAKVQAHIAQVRPVWE